jgi:TPR repeat protein
VGAIVLLAAAIDSIEEPTVEQQAESFGLWLAAAAEGEALAERRVGECYRDGVGCERNPDVALQWLTAAAAQGDEVAALAVKSLEAQRERESRVGEMAPQDMV